MGPVVRGQAFQVDIRCATPSETPVTDLQATLDDPTGAPVLKWGPEADTPTLDPYFHARFEVQVPHDAPWSRPYYYRNSVRENHYQYRDLAWRHLPSRPAALEAVVSGTVLGQVIQLRTPVQAREANLPNGYVMRKLQVVPALSVSASPRERVIVPEADGNTLGVAVDLANNYPGPIEGTLQLSLPEGWTSTPPSHNIAFTQAGQRQSYTFQVFVSDLGSEAHTLKAVATAMGQEFTEGYQVIRHSHMETRYLYRPADVLITGLDVSIAPGLRVGYVMGVGDEVPSGIEQLGAEVHLLSASDLGNMDFSALDAIVVGTRAYAVRQDLHTYNHRLLDYAHGGGNLIVLYQTQEFVPNDMAPLPGHASAECRRSVGGRCAGNHSGTGGWRISDS